MARHTRHRFETDADDLIVPCKDLQTSSLLILEQLMAQVVADASRNGFQISRAEDALRVLRRRIHNHLDEEVRLGRLCQTWQNCWLSQQDQLRRQVERLEAHLATWMPKAETAPTLSLVGTGREGE